MLAERKAPVKRRYANAVFRIWVGGVRRGGAAFGVAGCRSSRVSRWADPPAAQPFLLIWPSSRSPADAGAQLNHEYRLRPWAPAFAGMTGERVPASKSTTPAKAGAQLGDVADTHAPPAGVLLLRAPRIEARVECQIARGPLRASPPAFETRQIPDIKRAPGLLRAPFLYAATWQSHAVGRRLSRRRPTAAVRSRAPLPTRQLSRCSTYHIQPGWASSPSAQPRRT